MPDADYQADADEAKDRNFVTALARGLDVLRCFRPNETDLTNMDISQRTNLPKPTVSRLTHTLCKLDYLVADPRTGTYRLSAGVLQLGFGVLSGMEIGERASEVMRALRDGPNSYITVALAEAHRMDAVYIAVHRSREEIALTMNVGSRLPLFFSAIGRAILVGLTEEERAVTLKRADKLDPDQHERRKRSVEQALAEYESQGYCTGYGDWRQDVNGIAVPVFSLNGSRVYGLNVGGPAFHVKKKQLESYYARQLLEAAASLSHPD
ncbi:IclR family transcriptional regulator [Rhodobacteraceae bacterium F11138]|nr:IclR family transcriptional regulator [Rhodobacteraceae bacterium F11138]